MGEVTPFAPEAGAGRVFPTTHWSVVLATDQVDEGEVSQALARLCRTYWYPLYAHVRRRGYGPEDAQDLTQEFFARLLAKKWLRMADPGRGRFRCFLLAALNHFLTNEWNRAQRVKRGGHHTHVPLDTESGERRYAQEIDRGLNPEEIYERNWALRVLEHVRSRLREAYTVEGKADRFEIWERFLPGRESPVSYAEAAAQLGVPEGTLKSDVHRLKRRYGAILREEIAHTLVNPQEIDDELRYLIGILGR